MIGLIGTGEDNASYPIPIASCNALAGHDRSAATPRNLNDTAIGQQLELLADSLSCHAKLPRNLTLGDAKRLPWRQPVNPGPEAGGCAWVTGNQLDGC